MFRPVLRPPTRLLYQASRAPPTRTLIAVPRSPSAAPFTERRGDRALPEIRPRWRHILSIPLFGLILAGSAAALFNYQRSSSSVVSSTLYALRVHSRGRELLGDGISFRSRAPWIRGTLDQFRGVIDISYAVKGSAGEGVMHFKSVRKERMGMFETIDWSLVMKDGRRIVLLEDYSADPFPQPEAA